MSTVPKARSGRGVRPLRFTKDEYYRMAEIGLFHGRRVELIEGRLMVLSPQQPPHASTVHRVARALARLLEPVLVVRAQLPLDLGAASEPEPDVAAVPGPEQQYHFAHPTTAALVVEVSDTTLAYDRGPKASLYARSGIGDYWIVNIAEAQLEVHRDPVPDAAQPHGHRYATRAVLRRGEAVAPLALPGATLPVAELLG
jgi:Uma2 family endonuclease